MYFGGIEDEAVVIDRPGQLNSVDFIGCIKSISINGNEKNLISDSLNRTGLRDTCNYVEGGACSRGDECGFQNTCVPHWSYHKCTCGVNDILAPDCGPAFEPFTMTEGQEVHFYPTRKFRHDIKLSKIPSLSTRWRRDLDGDGIDKNSMSLSFRTLTNDGVLMRVLNRGVAYTMLAIEEGILVYKSLGATSSTEVVLSTEVNVADGSWHTLRLEVNGNILRILLDEARVGYEVEFSAVHNFVDPAVSKYVIGDAASGKGYRGCIANFTLNGELQSVRPFTGTQLLEADVPSGVHMEGCDVEILRVAQTKSDLGVALTVVIVFFVVVLVTITLSFGFFRWRSKHGKKSQSGGQMFDLANRDNSQSKNNFGVANRSFDMRDEESMQLNNSRVPLHPTSGRDSAPKPDVIDPDHSIHHRRALSHSPLNNEDPMASASNVFGASNNEGMEHYDIENASSIAPSDIDIVYHYKGYRDGNRGRSLPKKKGRGNNSAMHNTPLARLSPSSEMSHMTPRILTLKDLSEKPLPTSLLTEQSERSLNSPVSHLSSGSRHMHPGGCGGGNRGLTSENVARFNQQRATPTGRATTPKNTSTLVNTLDLVSMGSESRKHNKTPISSRDIDTSSDSSSSDSHGDDDSFTCSEFECDSNSGGGGGGGRLGSGGQNGGPSQKELAAATADNAMVFSKLMDFGPSSRSSSSRRRFAPEDDDDEHLSISRPDSAVGGRSWENLLTWWPDYESFSGVFKDIAELPHASSITTDQDICRPNPLGDHLPPRSNDEEYI